ncbi:hypothetical protein INT44_000484 [Umbelopsis vinacea]|uniref:BHLH domain-containing protein n=1 Tax=Umbelopsis vinacea TaxID=44442 RepID=A0A8H7PLM3_9FUNG|nr:hypothetical protein INT44_000484 [Umbelopsis vinacea]
MCPYGDSMAPLASIHHFTQDTMTHKETPPSIHSQPRSSEEESPSECTEDDISDEDDDMTPVKNESSDHPQGLFLNFSSNLTEQSFGKKKTKSKRQNAYKVNGINILNRNNLDSKTAIERIRRRRENHNYVERRRRDVINNTIMDIAAVVPNAMTSGQKPNKGNILRLALDYIKQLQTENRQLRQLTSSDERSSMIPLTPPANQVPTPTSVSTPHRPPVHSDIDQPSPFRLKHHDMNVYAASAPNSPNFSRTYSPQTASLPSSPIHGLPLHDDHSLPSLSLPPARPFPSRSLPSYSPGPQTPVSPHATFLVQQPPVLHYNFVHQPPATAPLPAPSGLRPILPMRPGPPGPPQRPLNYAQNRMTGLERQYGSVCRY